MTVLDGLRLLAVVVAWLVLLLSSEAVSRLPSGAWQRTAYGPFVILLGCGTIVFVTGVEHWRFLWGAR